ncbi:hypothetical protein [Actinocorallia longicatena]|uniref:Uncharacterized protein n=1 Tax=Actinocorallia longicatena TaxID=111803 RepID=A0ABP6QBM9_9ACTN
MRVRTSVLLLLLLPLLLCASGGRASATTAPSGTAVLVGIPALRWDQVNARDTPHLWKVMANGDTAALSVRTLGTVACPIDAWLTVSAGARAARDGGACATLPETVPGIGGTALPGYAETRRRNLEGRFQAPVGLLGETVHAAGGCTSAVGPGAALAVADARGALDHYSPAVTGMRTGCAITVVDLDEVLRSPEDPAAVRAADVRLGEVLALVPPSATVLVAGLSDGTGDLAHPVTATPRLRALAVTGAGFPAGRSLTSDSTRRDGTVITPDLTATLLTAAGITVPDEAIGRALRPGAPRDRDQAAAVRDLAGQDVGAQTYRTVLPRFFTGLVIAQVAFFVLAALLLRRDGLRGRRRVLAVALASAAVPASTYLVNLLPWMTSGSPKAALLGGIALCDAAIVTVALAGPWRRSLLGPGTVVAGITALTIAVDLLAGTPLQTYSLMGYSPLVGGRYYGLGNIAFAVFATSTFLAAAGIAHGLTRRGHGRGTAVTVMAVLCLAAMALDGAPMWGADFGGVIAIVPGLAIVTLMAAGKSVSPARLALFCAVGGVIVLGVAFLDHLRPAVEQTHLGRFFGDLSHGHAGPVVERKFLAMARTFRNPTLVPIVLAGIGFLVVALRRPGRVGGGALHRTFERAPLLRAGLAGALATAVIGLLVNDSGVAVLALALVVAIPLALTATVNERL